MLGEGNSLPIQGLKIEWDKIERFSYLRNIDAFRDLEYLSFNKNITIFVGEKCNTLIPVALNLTFLLNVKQCIAIVLHCDIIILGGGVYVSILS